MLTSYVTNGKQLQFTKPIVMSIVNLTPDSFYDGGKLLNTQSILKFVEQKIIDGATIIDIGAASSKPNAIVLSAQEEIMRLQEPLIAIRKEFSQVLLSLDTYQSQVAEFAIHHGIDIINDISGGELDAAMLPLIAKHNLPYIMMHMQGTPKTMQQQPTYSNVVTDVYSYFEKKINYCKQLGIQQLILDVGFGFGKTTAHNYQLLKQLSHYKSLGYPLLAGLSRKSMINNIIGTTATEALNGTAVLNTIALLNGATILRVHDVKEASQAIKLVSYYQASSVI